MNKLDLHGVRHEDVRRKVTRFVEDNWGKGQPVKIITGRSVQMNMLVFGVLSEYKVSFMPGGPVGTDTTYTVVSLDKT